MAQEPDPALALVAQLCSKLCHDLAGVIGAIANGAELLEDEDDPDIRTQAVELLAQSAAQAGRRLRFFRIAFGAAGAMGDTIDFAELRDAAEGQLGGGRLKIEWPAATGGMPKPQAKLLLNLLLVVASGMPRGGVIRPALSGTGFVLAAEGDGAALPEAVRNVLTGSPAPAEGIAAVALHALRLAAAAGATVTSQAIDPKRFAVEVNTGG